MQEQIQNCNAELQNFAIFELPSVYTQEREDIAEFAV